MNGISVVSLVGRESHLMYGPNAAVALCRLGLRAPSRLHPHANAEEAVSFRFEHNPVHFPPNGLSRHPGSGASSCEEHAVAVASACCLLPVGSLVAVLESLQILFVARHVRCHIAACSSQ